MARKPHPKWFARWMFGRDKRKAKFEAVRERDGENCWRCGHPMNFELPRNKRRSATIEHVRPLADGGTWAMNNLKLCHTGCNRHLGANSPEQKERMRLAAAR
jgi:5-methylcytosine-specific restriction endonuclease McrA